jgi:hypothetical protein
MWERCWVILYAGALRQLIMGRVGVPGTCILIKLRILAGMGLG